jgi:hypothetical protein
MAVKYLLIGHYTFLPKHFQITIYLTSHDACFMIVNGTAKLAKLAIKHKPCYMSLSCSMRDYRRGLDN